MDPHHHFPPGAGPETHAFAFAPFLGGLMFLLFLLLIAGTLFYLLRSGRLQTPGWLAARPSPELEARKILSERFARGDISADEFMERASVLNWTPGVEPVKPKSKRRKRS
jgi:uncharacterized membrane protein